MRDQLKLWRFAPLLAGAWAVVAPADAQCKKDDDPGPSVALVLSGGGALAASQIGAIRELERIGVPIHCIVGNSMGAVIGALYVAEVADDKKTSTLESIFINYDDWTRNSWGTNEYRDLSYRSKEEQHDFFAGAVVGIDGGKITLPPGLTSLRGMRSYLREHLNVLPADGSFNQFPIHFRAVATNLGTGLPAVFERGDIVDAALASMAVPGLYPAQKIEGEWYVDGGMSNQLPVDVAKCMNGTPGPDGLIPMLPDCIGADIVIAIDTTIKPVLSKDKPPTAVETAMQLVNLKVFANREAQIDLLVEEHEGWYDVHITPEIPADIGVADYTKTKMTRLFELGRAAAMAKEGELKRILEIVERPSRSPAKDTAKETLTFAEVVVDNASGVNEDVIRARLGIEPGEDVTRGEIRSGLANVNALGVFEDVDYSIEQQGANSVLHVDTSPSPLGKDLLQFGARLSTSLDDEATYQLLARYTRKPTNSYGGRLSATLGLGTDNVFDLDYVHPLGGAARTFVEAGVGFASRRVPVAVGDEQLAQRIDKTAEVTAAVGYEFGQWGAASVGVFATALQSDIKVGEDVGIGAQTGNYTGFTGRLAVDRFNSASFPTSGFMGDLRLVQYYVTRAGGDGTDGLRSEGSFALASEIDPVGLFVRFDGGNIDQRTEGLPIFQLGGFKRLSGFLDNSVPATRYGLWRIEAFTRLGSEDGVVPIYFGGTLEMARVDVGFVDLDLGDDVTAGSIYAAIDTVLGPAYLAYGMGEGGRQALYFYFGQAF